MGAIKIRACSNPRLRRLSLGTFTFNAPSTGTVSSSSPALAITNGGSGDALTGASESGDGILGATSSGHVQAGVHGTASSNSAGVWGENGTRPSDFEANDPRWSAGVRGSNWSTGGPGASVSGVYAEGETGYGLYAISAQNSGVYGECYSGSQSGVEGYSENGPGVSGQSASADGAVGTANGSGIGVAGTSTNGIGVRGETKSAQQAGVAGINNSGSTSGGPGVYGSSKGFDGVHGESQSSTHAGVSGKNTSGSTSGGPGVYGSSKGFDGVHGVSQSSTHAGVSGINTGQGFGVWASGDPAGYFHGDVLVTGDVVLVNSSGDVAEDFDVEADSAHQEPGTVLVIGSGGKLCASVNPYDTRVAGVVSGAGELKPAIVLQRLEGRRSRCPIALVGKAFCKVDASFGSICAGDLLTTSATPGHAMKVSDYSRATGAILGKALKDLDGGQGMIPILVTPR